MEIIGLPSLLTQKKEKMVRKGYKLIINQIIVFDSYGTSPSSQYQEGKMRFANRVQSELTSVEDPNSTYDIVLDIHSP